MKKSFNLFLTFILLSLIFALHPLKVRASFEVVDTRAIARELVELTNNERRAVGLNLLNENSELSRAAYAKAADMLAQGYFSHTSPGGKAFYRWVDNAGYEYSAVAENLAVNLNMISPEQMVVSWLNSPGHRTNLLSGRYTELGMGVSHGIYQGQEAVFAVHIFATPKNKIVTVEKENSSVTLIDKKVVREETQPVVKNINVLGESTSTEVTSSQLATSEEEHEMKDITNNPKAQLLSVEDESYAHKSWFKKLLDFLLIK